MTIIYQAITPSYRPGFVTCHDACDYRRIARPHVPLRRSVRGEALVVPACDNWRPLMRVDDCFGRWPPADDNCSDGPAALIFALPRLPGHGLRELFATTDGRGEAHALRAGRIKLHATMACREMRRQRGQPADEAHCRRQCAESRPCLRHHRGRRRRHVAYDATAHVAGMPRHLLPRADELARAQARRCHRRLRQRQLHAIDLLFLRNHCFHKV